MHSRALILAASAAVLLVISGTRVPIAAQQGAAKPPDMLAIQVMLDRARFSPGEIDGKGGPNTTRAIEAYERAKGRTAAEGVAALDGPVTMPYTITADDAAGPFDAIPEDMMEKAALKRLSFASLLEALGERFHASPNLLKRLNPSAQFTAGETIEVPNVLAPPEPTSGAGVSITVTKGTSALTLGQISPAEFERRAATQAA